MLKINPNTIFQVSREKDRKTSFNHDGGARLLASPWPGIDVVLFLHASSAVGVKLLPSLSSMNDNDIFTVQPNPFNTSTSIWVRLPENTQVSLDIINMQGKLVERLVKGKLKRGAHQFFWNAENRSSGIYFIKLIAGSSVYGRRIRLLR